MTNTNTQDSPINDFLRDDMLLKVTASHPWYANIINFMVSGYIPVTPRPTNSTREVENLSDETEELCSSSFFPDLCNTYLELAAVMLGQCRLDKIEP